MEHTPPQFERAPINRFLQPKDEDCEALADVFLGPSKSNPVAPVAQPDRLELVVAAHLDRGSALFDLYCKHLSAQQSATLGIVEHAGAGWQTSSLDKVQTRRRATIHQAIGHFADDVDHVCVLLPAHQELGALLSGLLQSSQEPDSLTILSTPAEGDTVATYRQIKSVALLCPGLVPFLRVVIIGQDAAACAGAGARITQTAERFLSIHVGCTVLPEEQPVYTEHRYDPMDPMHVSPEAYRSPAPRPAPQMPLRGIEALIGLPTSLAIRCPLAPDVVIAVDTLGQLHVVAATFQGPDWQQCPDPITRLELARAFAARHAAVLAATDPRISPQPATPEAHLVVDRYSAAAPFLGSALRIHLAMMIDVDGVRRYGASPLEL